MLSKTGVEPYNLEDWRINPGVVGILGVAADSKIRLLRIRTRCQKVRGKKRSREWLNANGAALHRRPK